MAFLTGITFTGPIGNFSAYRMRGCKDVVIRQKGGPSREEVKRGKSFANTRRNMSEFGGCSRTGLHVRMALHPLKPLADYNFSGDINKILKKVQKLDTVSEWGRRAIRLSQHPHLLEGFQLNKDTPTFDSVVRSPVLYSIDRANRSAHVEIPELVRGINYFPNNNHALFNIVVTLGIVPDFEYNPKSREYEAPAWYTKFRHLPKEVATGWSPSLKGTEGVSLNISLKDIPADASWSLMLSIGIRYGAMHEGGSIEQVKRAGAAKIVAIRGTADDALAAEPDDNTDIEADVFDDVASPPSQTLETNAPAAHASESSVKMQYTYTVRSASRASGPTTQKAYTYTLSENPPQQEQVVPTETHILHTEDSHRIPRTIHPDDQHKDSNETVCNKMKNIKLHLAYNFSCQYG